MTIYGSGTINLNINQSPFIIALGNEEYITIDASTMEAYKGTELKNRLVTGDYSNFVLNVGDNSISWSGNITEIEIEKYSRWI
jgi:phage-related protein